MAQLLQLSALSALVKANAWIEMLAAQRNAMAADFSWTQSAKHYVAAYRDVAPDPAKGWFDEVLREQPAADLLQHALPEVEWQLPPQVAIGAGVPGL